MDYRKEHDSMGEVLVPADRYYGAQTQRSADHFKLGRENEKMQREILCAFARMKKAAARANFALLPQRMTVK